MSDPRHGRDDNAAGHTPDPVLDDGHDTGDNDMNGGTERQSDAGREWLTALADDELLAELGRALDAVDPVPESVLEGARAAFTWRTIDTELAQIVFDSSQELAGVRSEDVNRQLTFEAPGVEIEVMVVENGSRRLVGQLVPPTERTVELVGSDSVVSTETDRLGRFSFDDLAPGPVRLVVLGADGERLVQTEWVLF